MTARIFLLAVALALAACGKTDTGRLQGWVEADFVFVGPDEAGQMPDGLPRLNTLTRFGFHTVRKFNGASKELCGAMAQPELRRAWLRDLGSIGEIIGCSKPDARERDKARRAVEWAPAYGIGCLPWRP